MLASALLASSLSYMSLATTLLALSFAYSACASSCRTLSYDFFRVNSSSITESYSFCSDVKSDGTDESVGGLGTAVRGSAIQVWSQRLFCLRFTSSRPYLQGVVYLSIAEAHQQLLVDILFAYFSSWKFLELRILDSSLLTRFHFYQVLFCQLFSRNRILAILLDVFAN